MKLIELNIAKITELCKKYRVKSLAVFGSILRGRSLKFRGRRCR